MDFLGDDSDFDLLFARLGELGQALAQCRSLTQVVAELELRIRMLLPVDRVSLWVNRDDFLERHSASSTAAGSRVLLETDSPLTCCARGGAWGPVWKNSGFDEGMRAGLLAAVGDRGDGVLVVESADPGAFRERTHPLMSTVAGYVAIALSNALAREAIERSARIDRLTGLANRSALDEILPSEVARARRSCGPLSLVLADLDHFDAYNDGCGRAQGDECLRRIGSCLTSVCRGACDLAARYGAEEFALVLPNVGLDEAMVIADRLRRRVMALRLPHPASSVGPCLSLSAGVATLWDDSPGNAEELIAAAARGLLEAKREGRNCCRAAQRVIATR